MNKRGLGKEWDLKKFQGSLKIGIMIKGDDERNI